MPSRAHFDDDRIDENGEWCSQRLCRELRRAWIAEFADVLLLLYCEDLYWRDSLRKGLVDVIVAKNRKGATGEATLVFSPAHGNFDNYAVEGTL